MRGRKASPTPLWRSEPQDTGTAGPQANHPLVLTEVWGGMGTGKGGKHERGIAQVPFPLPPEHTFPYTAAALCHQCLWRPLNGAS